MHLVSMVNVPMSCLGNLHISIVQVILRILAIYLIIEKYHPDVFLKLLKLLDMTSKRELSYDEAKEN